MQTSLAVGFLRLVHVTANDPVEAEKQAIGLVKSEWDSSDYASTDRGGPPHLTINTVGVLSWWHRLLGFPKGYMFFSEDGVQTPSNQRLGGIDISRGK